MRWFYVPRETTSKMAKWEKHQAGRCVLYNMLGGWGECAHARTCAFIQQSFAKQLPDMETVPRAGDPAVNTTTDPLLSWECILLGEWQAVSRWGGWPPGGKWRRKKRRDMRDAGDRLELYQEEGIWAKTPTMRERKSEDGVGAFQPGGRREAWQSRQAGAASWKENVEKRNRKEARRACWLYKGFWSLTERRCDMTWLQGLRAHREKSPKACTHTHTEVAQSCLTLCDPHGL